MLNQTRKINNWYNLFFLGLFLFKFGMVAFDYIFIQNYMMRVLSLVGLMLVFVSFFMVPLSNPLSGGIRFLYNFLLFVGAVTILRGLFDPELSRSHLFNEAFIWAYIIPWIFLIKPTPELIRCVFRFSMVNVLFSIFFCLMFYKELYVLSAYIISSLGNFDSLIINRYSLPNSLINPVFCFLGVFFMFKKKYFWIMSIGTSLAILSSFSGGRRSSSVLVLGFIVMSLYFYLIRKKKSIIYVFLFVALVTTFQFSVDHFVDSHFEILSDKLTDDTRSGTEKDFYRDMDAEGWVYGRGMCGTYRSPEVAHSDRLHRFLIETGYLNLILHGGVLLLVPYVLLLFKAGYNGFFKSKNYLLKGFGVYAFMHILFLYPGGTPRLSLQYVILFIVIRCCFSSKWLNYTNEDVKCLSLFK